MKQNTTVWTGVVAVIVMMILGYWLVTSSRQTAELASADSNSTGTVTSQDGVSGATTQTDNPVVNPFGDAAGGIVDAHSMTVAEVVAKLDATEFVSLFNAENGAALVSGSGKFTVFVPTNGAFDRLPQGTISDMSSSQKARLVAYHVIKGRALDTDAIISGSVQTASGDALNVNFGINKTPLVGSAIVITQYNCSNGVVYTIDNVLLPPKK